MGGFQNKNFFCACSTILYMAHIEHKNKSEYYFADDMWTFLGVALLYEYGNPFLELLTIEDIDNLSLLNNLSAF